MEDAGLPKLAGRTESRRSLAARAQDWCAARPPGPHGMSRAGALTRAHRAGEVELALDPLPETPREESAEDLGLWVSEIAGDCLGTADPHATPRLPVG